MCSAPAPSATSYDVQASASYVTSRGNGIVLENSEFTLFDVASSSCQDSGMLLGGRFGSIGHVGTRGEEAVAVTVHSPRLRGRLFGAAPTVRDEGEKGGFVAASRHLAAVESLTAFVGRQRPLPEWADKGAIIGLQGGTEHVRAITEQLQQAGVPIAALWLQDWTGSRKTIFGQRLWWNWELDDSYKDWRELREQLSAVKGAAGPIRLLRYVNPMFSNVLVAGKNTTSPQFQIAMAESFLVVQSEPAAENTPHLVKVAGFDAALLDLTNPRAREWMRDEVLRSEVLGDRALGSNSNGGSGSGGASSLTMSDGWMADFGEAIPCHGVRLHDGTPPCTHHNEFPVEWARLNVDAARGAGAENDVLILRSGFTTSPRVAPLFWLGDQLHTWDEHDGIASTVTATLSGGFSGFALTHSDAGGYNGFVLWIAQLLVGARIARTRELLTRWVELCAFSGAVFRTHEGLIPEFNHRVWSDRESIQHFRRFALIFAAFRPYRRQLMEEAASRGWPIVRHPVLHYPTDATLLADKAEHEGGTGRIWEFMLGADWLIVPVLTPRATDVRAYVPEGEWVSLWCEGGTIHGPAWQSVPAPIGAPAVYHRAGAPSHWHQGELRSRGILDC